jgi:hypothetical protein
MSINSIGNLPPGVIGGAPLNRGAGTADRARVNGEREMPTALPAAPTAAGVSAGASVPAEPPAGTDPALWKILTSEERQYFAGAGARGPLTYGYLGRSQAAPTVPVARGGRLDLRA